MYTPVSARAASAYRQVGSVSRLEGASPHALIAILFDELTNAVVSARGALARGDAAVKGESILRAVRILDEGLKAGLNMQQGGELAANLMNLYNYCISRLTHANLKNDDGALQEVIQLIEPVAQGWKEIEGKVHA